MPVKEDFLCRLASHLKDKDINSHTASRRKKSPFMPLDIWHSARAQRDLNDIEADTNVFRKRILRKPQVRQHHNLTLLRRRHVHPG